MQHPNFNNQKFTPTKPPVANRSRVVPSQERAAVSPPGRVGGERRLHPSREARCASAPKTKRISRRPAASMLRASVSKLLARPNRLFAAESPPKPKPAGTQTARTTSSRSPTRTHTSRPRAPTHALPHLVRDAQERRLVRSRSQSQPGRAREADSRPGPFPSQKREEHWSTARSATPTSLG